MSGGTHARAAAALAIALSGCGFGTPGGGSVMTSQLGDAGEGTGSDTGDDGTTGSQAVDDGSGPGGDASAEGTAGMTGVGSITSPTSEDDGGSSSGEPVDDTTTTGVPPDPCANPPPQTITIEVSAATVTAPMITGNHPSHGVYAYSTQSGAGTVSFPFATDCEDTWQAWAFVYDQDPGFSTQTDPDSFDVWLDETGSTLWVYGCQNDAIFPAPSQWQWVSVNDTGLCVFENDPITFTLPAGPHAMHFRNVEGGSAGDGASNPGVVAAIARIVISNDPAFSP